MRILLPRQNIFSQSAILTGTNCGVIHSAASWVQTRPERMGMLDLDWNRLNRLQEGVQPGRVVPMDEAVDCFKAVYGAERYQSHYFGISNEEIDDTLGRLVLITGPREIGSHVRSLRDYQMFADQFKPRFADVVSHSMVLGAQLAFDGADSELPIGVMHRISGGR